jgi:hypothetical protein
MKTKVLIKGIVIIIIVMIAGFTLNYKIKSHRQAVRDYFFFELKQSGEISQGYLILSSIGLSDMPGFLAVLGGQAAKSFAGDLLSKENSSYSHIDGSVFNIFVDDTLSECAKNLHDKQLQNIDTLTQFSRRPIIAITELKAALENNDTYFDKTAECLMAFDRAYPKKLVSVATTSTPLPAIEFAAPPKTEADPIPTPTVVAPVPSVTNNTQAELAHPTAKNALSCTQGCPVFSIVYNADEEFRKSFMAALTAASIPKLSWVPFGVEGPMQPVVIGDKTYLKGFVCQPHNCGDNQINFLYLESQKRTVGEYSAENADPVWFGNPSQLEQEKIEDQ